MPSTNRRVKVDRDSLSDALAKVGLALPDLSYRETAASSRTSEGTGTADALHSRSGPNRRAGALRAEPHVGPDPGRAPGRAGSGPGHHSGPQQLLHQRRLGGSARDRTQPEGRRPHPDRPRGALLLPAPGGARPDWPGSPGVRGALSLQPVPGSRPAARPRRRRVRGQGLSETELARGTLTRYQPERRSLDRALRSWRPTVQPKATGKSRNPVAAACSCSPPRRIRLSANNLEAGKITCGYCDGDFKPVR